MLFDPRFAFPHLVSVLVGVVFLALAFRRPRAARAAFALLFAAACAANAITVARSPASYLEYGPLALLDVYEWFIEGPFPHVVVPFVTAIAIGQGLVAVGLVLGGRHARRALGAAFVFLVAISPLGVGSAFPSTLLMAAAAAKLLASRASPAVESSLLARRGRSAS